MKKLLIILIGVTFILNLSTISVEATIYYPSDDAFVYSAYPETEYGLKITFLFVSDRSTYSKQTYLKFDLSSLSGSIINSAALKLYKCNTSTYERDVNLYRVAEDWDEETITWNNKPSNYSTIISSTSVKNGGIWYTWTGEEFKDLIQKWVDGTYDNYGMVLMTSYGGDYEFYSKEYFLSSYRPYLEIESTPIPEPSTLILLGSLATGLFGFAGLRRRLKE